MDLYINQDELVRAIGGVQGVVERRSTNQILGHVLLTAVDGALQVTATDTELTVVTRHPARVERTGSVTVNAVHFFQVVRSLPPVPVHLVVEESTHYLVLDAPPAHFRLLGTSSDDFPPLPPFEAASSLKVKAGGLLRIIDETLFAISSDDNRYGLNGGHWESTEGPDGEPRLRMVTTDGSRLCYSETSFSGSFGMGRHMLVPRKALAECRKLLIKPDEEVEVSFADRAAALTVGTSMLHTRLVDGEFPAYRSVLPSRYLRRVRVERQTFVDALRRVALEAQDRASTVRMEFNREEVLVSARSVEHGEARHPVPVDFEGEPITMGFNVRFFLDALAVLEVEQIVLELGEHLAPCLIRAGERDDVLFIVMPIRLD